MNIQEGIDILKKINPGEFVTIGLDVTSHSSTPQRVEWRVWYINKFYRASTLKMAVEMALEESRTTTSESLTSAQKSIVDLNTLE